MKIHHIGVAIVTAATAICLTTLASAQTAPKPAAAAPVAGPTIPGLCIINVDRAIATSTVGKSVGARLDQLKGQAEAELTADQTPLQTDLKAFQTKAATLTVDQRNQQGAALQKREEDLQRKAELRRRELAATQDKALQRIGAAIEPIVKQAFTQRSCGILLNGNAVIQAVPTMDLTDAVIASLNATLQTLTFEREHIDPATLGAAQ